MSADKAANPNVTWFEKTIEYKFLLEYLEPNVVTSPLDGDAEQYWGDLIDGKEGEFRLIEFKVDKGALTSEKDKYLAHDEKTDLHYTRYVLEQKGSSVFTLPGAKGHWLVYGQKCIDKSIEPPAWSLELWALPYAEPDSKKSAKLEKGEMLGRVSAESLYEYMQELQTLRDRNGKSSGGGVVLATVGGTTRAHGQEEFIRVYEERLELTREIASQRRRSLSEVPGR
jgi:hypothetical protein